MLELYLCNNFLFFGGKGEGEHRPLGGGGHRPLGLYKYLTSRGQGLCPLKRRCPLSGGKKLEVAIALVSVHHRAM